MVSLDRVSNRGGTWWQLARASILAGLAAGLLATSAVAQQTGRVVGRVQSGDGAPVAEVQVYLRGTEIGVLTRSDGRFTLANVPAGTHTIRAERIGYSTVEREVTISAGGEVEANFTLESQALGLDEIVVTGTAGAARRREIGNTISQINVADIPDKPTTVTDIITAAAPRNTSTRPSPKLPMRKRGPSPLPAVRRSASGSRITMRQLPMPARFRPSGSSPSTWTSSTSIHAI
jgi:hypothetical protein